MEILQVKNVSKSFDGRKIVDGVSFSVERGKIVGLLGKNGSGKTTVIKMINDLLTKDSGEILINGEKIGVKTKKIVSYLPERSYLDTSKKIYQIFDYFEDFYTDFDRQKAEKMIAELDLTLDMKISKMSKGMREKISLALVMSRNADLYVLDEPLGGVDPVTRDKILKTILSNFGDNSSLIITTHLISDVEKILDKVIFIDGGKILLEGDADKLRESENASINDIFRRVVK